MIKAYIKKISLFNKEYYKVYKHDMSLSFMLIKRKKAHKKKRFLMFLNLFCM